MVREDMVMGELLYHLVVVLPCDKDLMLVIEEVGMRNKDVFGKSQRKTSTLTINLSLLLYTRRDGRPKSLSRYRNLIVNLGQRAHGHGWGLERVIPFQYTEGRGAVETSFDTKHSKHGRTAITYRSDPIDPHSTGSHRGSPLPVFCENEIEGERGRKKLLASVPRRLSILARSIPIKHRSSSPSLPSPPDGGVCTVSSGLCRHRRTQQQAHKPQKAT